MGLNEDFEQMAMTHLTAVYKAVRRKGTQKKSLKLIPLDSNEPALVFYMEGFVETTGDSR